MAEKLFHVGIKALIRNKEGKILLLQVNPKQLSGDQPAYWDIPGGRIEHGATVEETLRRELKEETGITTIEAMQFLTGVVSNIQIPLKDSTFVGLVLMIYEVSVADTINIKLSAEHVAFEWVSPRLASERLGHKYPVEFTEKIAQLKQGS